LSEYIQQGYIVTTYEGMDNCEEVIIVHIAECSRYIKKQEGLEELRCPPSFYLARLVRSVHQ